MTDSTRWWWLRHAPIAGPGGRIHGHDDVPYRALIESEKTALADTLPAGAVWMASHLARTRDTAFAISGRQPRIEEDLAEQNFGRWQGLTWDEVRDQDQDAWRTFWEDPAENPAPGGESFAEAVRRVTAAVRRLTLEHAGRDIVAVAHAGTIRAALAQALGQGHSAALKFAVDPLSLTRIDHDGGAWRVISANETFP
jgi:alpha-ribazole phosphatase